MLPDDFPRESWLNLLVKKEDGYKAVKCFSADTFNDVLVEIVTSEGGRDFRGYFTDACVGSKIKRAYTAVNLPPQNGYIECASSIVDRRQQGVRIQAEQLFRDPEAPPFPRVWSEATTCVVDCMKRTATRSNSDYLSPDETYTAHQSPSAPSILQPGYYLQKRSRKHRTEGALCFHIGPAPLNYRDTSRVLAAGASTISTTRDTTLTAHPELHEPVASQETSGNGPSRGNVDLSLFSVTADSDGDDNVIDIRSHNSDDGGSEPVVPIAETVRPKHDPVPAIKHNVRQPRAVEDYQGTNAPRPIINDQAQSTVHVDDNGGVRVTN